MGDMLGLISTSVAPFLENKTIVYLILLLIIGIDSISSFNMNTTTLEDNPLMTLSAQQVNEGFYFIITNGTDFYGDKTCIARDPLGLLFITDTLYHRASVDEINLYCRENPCSSDNVESIGGALVCSFSDPMADSPNSTKINKGFFGDMLTGTINFVGQGIPVLNNMVIFTWELFLLMIMIPIFLWGINASTQAQ